MTHKFTSIISWVLVLTLTSCAQNHSILTQSKIEAINSELNDSFFKGDLSVIEKYLYEGTEIYIDLDPDPNSGQEQISLKEYRDLIKISLMFIEDIAVEEEIVSIDIDEQKGEATLVVKANISSDIMGMESVENTISTTLFGLVNGEIKILRTSDQLVSSSLE